MSAISVVIFRLFLLGLGFLVHSHSRADVNDYVCGPLTNTHGPYDYRYEWKDKDKKVDIDTAHLPPQVVNLVRGNTSVYIGHDLDYALRAFPNHHVALMAMARLGEKEKTAKPAGANFVVECYFQRAVRFSNDDAIVRILYASYLSKAGKRVEALNQLSEAARLGSDSANANYNMGLIYYDLKEYEKALYHAQEAYRLGFPLLGLRDKLKRAGKWNEPVARSEESGK
jgi:tetratricopeptide (TPR) repeat protein